MKPKEIRKWFLLLTIALSLVSSEYCSSDKTDTLKYKIQKESKNSIEQSFRENDSYRLTSRVLTRRFHVRNTRGYDFTEGKVSHRSESPNVAKSIRNEMREKVQATRRSEIPNIINDISFFRSNEIRRSALRGQRSFRRLDSTVDMLPVRNSRMSNISSKLENLTPKDPANTRTMIRKSDKLPLKQNNIMQEGNRRFNIGSNRLSHKNLEERSTVFKTNRIRSVNKENRQEQHNNIRGENTVAVARERLNIRNRFNNKNKQIFENMERSATRNKPFFSNLENKSARILNIKSRDIERNRLENSRFHRTEVINTILSKSTIRGIETRSTETRQDTTSLTKESMSLKRSRKTEVTDRNNNILRRTVRDVSLETRDYPQRVFNRNVVRVRREELLNRRIVNGNDVKLRENNRNYLTGVTRLQPFAEIERSTKKNDRKIALLLPFEITEQSKLRYATNSRSNRVEGTSTENTNSKRSVQNRIGNRINTRETDEREYRLKSNNIGQLSQRGVLQVTKIRNNINNHRFDINRRVEFKNEGDGKGTILDYGTRSELNKRTNRRYLSRASDRVNSETRKMLERNTAESSTRRIVERRSNLSTRRLGNRISTTDENKYPDHTRQLKETINSIERSFSKRRIMLFPETYQTMQRQVAEPGKDREVRNFERNTIFRINERNTEHWSIQYNEERKVISRKSERDRNLLKIRVEYKQSTRYHERHFPDNRDERIKAVRNRLFQLRSNERLSTEQRTLRNTRLINPGRITRTASFLKNDERTLLNLNRQERMRVTERNGRGFRGKLDILRRYSGNRRMEPLKDSKPFTQVIKHFENKLSEKIVQGRVLKSERIDRASKNFKLELLSSGNESIRGSTDRASRRIRINVLNVRNYEKRIAGDERRERRYSSETSRSNRRIEQSRNMERHNEREMLNAKTQQRLISLERSDIKHNGNKKSDSPMIPRNGRGFRGKQTNFLRMERILKYSFNRNNLFLTIFYRKQDASLNSQILKPVENGIRVIVSRRASQKFSFYRNTPNVRDYERASFENHRNIRNNQRTLLEKTGKMNSNLNVFVIQQSTNRNVRYTHRNYEESAIPFKPHSSSNRQGIDRTLNFNQSPTKRYDMRVERYLEDTRTGNQKMRGTRISEETKLDNIRQRISSNRLREDTILPVRGTLGSHFISRDNTYESRRLSSPQIHSSQKDHLTNNQKWNMRTFFSLTAHIILGLSIIMAASESDPMKSKSFKQRLFDALSLRTEVF